MPPIRTPKTKTKNGGKDTPRKEGRLNRVKEPGNSQETTYEDCRLVDILNQYPYFQHRLAIGANAVHMERDSEIRKEIAKETVEYLKKARGFGKSWSDVRYAQVMARESEGRYRTGVPARQAINLFMDILFGVEYTGKDNGGKEGPRSEAVDLIEGCLNISSPQDATMASAHSKQVCRSDLLFNLGRAGYEAMNTELGLNPSRWVSRSLLYSIAPHAWNVNFHSTVDHMLSHGYPDFEEAGSFVAQDAIRVAQSQLNDIAKHILNLTQSPGPEKTTYIHQSLNTAIREITGCDDPSSEQNAADYQATKNTGTASLGWGSVAGYWKSLGVFFAGIPTNLKDQAMDEDVRNDVITQITCIKRWNEEEKDCQKGSRSVVVKHKLLDEIMEKLKET